LTGWSRARLQRLIEAEDVLVNAKPNKPSYKLREHDEVEVELITRRDSSFTPEAIPIDVVYEDDTLVVVNKPAGLVVHPRPGMHSGTLRQRARYHFQQLPKRVDGVQAGYRSSSGSRHFRFACCRQN
jgi:23S rRNA pseudouridine1911/1915/1917 synthase